MNYLESLATEIRERVPAAELPEEDSRGLFLRYAVLALAKGEDVTAADVHNAWVSWMCLHDPKHDALVPYERLPPEVASMDRPFVEAIQRVARAAR